MADTRDGWFARRNMRLTSLEKLLVNSRDRAERTERTVRGLLDGQALPPEPRCLEVGCGQGAVTRVLVQDFGARAMCTDYDPSELALAQTRLADLPADRVELRQADARQLPFDDGTFDIVTEFQVWHHITGGWRQATAEVSRVLRPGGLFLFVDEVCLSIVGRLTRLLLRLDVVSDDALRIELARNSLVLEHYERKFWGMFHCKGVAVRGETPGKTGE